MSFVYFFCYDALRCTLSRKLWSKACCRNLLKDVSCSCFYFFDQGLRPTMPRNIPAKLVDLLQRCWKTDPSERPGFSETTVILQEILKEVLICHSWLVEF